MSDSKLDLSASKLKQLLEKLSGDDAFRARFVERPRAVLAEYGIALSDADMPKDIALPTKAAFAALLQAIEAPGGIGRAYLSFLMPQSTGAEAHFDWVKTPATAVAGSSCTSSTSVRSR